MPIGVRREPCARSRGIEGGDEVPSPGPTRDPKAVERDPSVRWRAPRGAPSPTRFPRARLVSYAPRAVSERSLSYVVSFDPHRHRVRVRATVRGPLPEPLSLQMPAWTPGSYLVRESARHVENLRVHADGAPCGVRKTAKDSWSVAHGGARAITVEYDVYAHELTVRTNHVSESHGYYLVTRTFPRPVQERPLKHN